METLVDIRDLVTELEAVRIGVPSARNGRTDPGAIAPEEFSDEVFEELSRLGEGAGGAVHKVMHKPSGLIMARKTITTLEVPRKQLERELSIAASAKHVNIIQWYGTYMSPSSSEIKILLEYGEGGSLEAVGKRIKERGARVGEKIAGRLAEGVGSSHGILWQLKPVVLTQRRFFKVLRIFTAKRPYTGTSNLPMFSCLGKASSNSAISVYQGSL